MNNTHHSCSHEVRSGLAFRAKHSRVVGFFNIKEDWTMLVLTRGKEQVITIGDTIRVTIVEVRNGKVRVGIDAPRDVRVIRAELLPTQEGDGNG